jgi:hypothetical protein
MGTKRAQAQKIFVFGNDRRTALPCVAPDLTVRRRGEADISDMIGVMAKRNKKMHKGGRSWASTTKRTLARADQRVIAGSNRVFQRSRNIGVLEVRIVAQDFCTARPACQLVEDIADTDAQSANDRTTTANLRIGCDSVEVARHGWLRWIHSSIDAGAEPIPAIRDTPPFRRDRNMTPAMQPRNPHKHTGVRIFIHRAGRNFAKR